LNNTSTYTNVTSHCQLYLSVCCHTHIGECCCRLAGVRASDRLLALLQTNDRFIAKSPFYYPQATKLTGREISTNNK